MKFSIATASNRREKHWRNEEITWLDFIGRVGSTIRTNETMAEYRAMPKNRQDDLKDVGGYCAGKLKDGIRKSSTVEYRSMLTLDMDYADLDVWEQIINSAEYVCCVYSTHKHTPQKPRLRLVIPLLRNVTAEEYVAVGRRIAADIGIEQFDDTTYEPARLMYWPSTSKDAEFVFQSKEGSFLDPDAILARYTDWHDSSQLPVSSRQKEIVKCNISKQADPLEKEGMIGAFCRAYSVQAAIEKFLPDIYQPSAIGGDRYDYIPADSAAGVLVHDDGKFVFSHHATDPACGKLLNAFDLVRLHKYAEFDGDAADDTQASRLPSFKAMQALFVDDESVRQLLAEERQAQAAAAFTIVDENWQNRLDINKSGRVEGTLKNLILILENDPNLKGIVYNKLGDSIEAVSPVPWKKDNKWWRDVDDSRLVAYVDRVYGDFSQRNYITAINEVTDERAFHPIHEYLDSLPNWDGVERVDTLLMDYLGAEDNEYTRAVMRKHLCAAIARVYTPGCKFDPMLVLNGGQGIGKSTLISKLGGAWYSESLRLSDIHDKTGVEKLQGYWIMEIVELAGLKKADEETLRGFLSTQNDIFRASYGRRTAPHLRQCVFFGTTNAESGYLRDITGNRRFLHVKVHGGSTKLSWQMTKEEVDQIWSEALVRYKAGEPIILEDSLLEMAKEEQREAMETDDREGLVREYLDTSLPEDWSKMSKSERREYIQGWSLLKPEQDGKVIRTRVCVNEIWNECFGKDIANMRKYEGNEIRAIMARMEGWTKYIGGKDNKMKFHQYAVCLGYVRITE